MDMRKVELDDIPRAARSRGAVGGAEPPDCAIPAVLAVDDGALVAGNIHAQNICSIESNTLWPVTIH
jgi:hypothetical protein